MTDIQDTRSIDEGALMEFVFRAVDEAGATLNAGLVVLGDKLGYYQVMRDGAAITPTELAERTGTHEPYAREWLAAQAAGGFVVHDNGRYLLPAEHAVALTDEDSPAFVGGLFQIALGTVADTARVVEAARTTSGVAWHEHNGDVHDGCERFFRPAYAANLIPSWLPAVGVVDRLREGARVADVGCGHGASTILMAQEFPRSTFVGSDYHADSIEVARRRAAEAGLGDQVSFEVAGANGFSGTGWDLITTFDALHDMGDPLAAAQRARQALADDGTWMVVEPMAGDLLEDNLHPIGRVYYGFSTLLCTPGSLSQPGAMAIGTQAGPARVTEIARQAGFSRARTAAETPFNRVMAFQV
jgi:hypothetical protein